MNISDIRDEIKSLVNKEIMLKVSGSRAKTTMMKGIVNEVYSNIFTVLVDGVNKSFTLMWQLGMFASIICKVIVE